MRPIFLDDGVDELLGGGSAAQQANAALELGHERHGVPDQVPPLDGCVPHLPTCKFPVEDTATIRTPVIKHSHVQKRRKTDAFRQAKQIPPILQNEGRCNFLRYGGRFLKAFPRSRIQSSIRLSV